MVPKSKVKLMSQIMMEFDERLHILQTEYRLKVRDIMKKAEKRKLEKVRKDLRS